VVNEKAAVHIMGTVAYAMAAVPDDGAERGGELPATQDVDGTSAPVKCWMKAGEAIRWHCADSAHLGSKRRRQHGGVAVGARLRGGGQ